MNSDGIGWELLIRSHATSGCSLKAALFTTYDRADERFLAEHLLPYFLKIGREPESEGVERQCFLLELSRRLTQLHGRLVVVSSMVREEPRDELEDVDEAYRWIWRSIQQRFVGRGGRAVQHAKLWLLHWGTVDNSGLEYLEIVISSSNLTRTAFMGQIQAAWRACIELHPQRSEARLNRWGLLPDFLRELGNSAGGPDLLEPFVALLARSNCPNGVTFVASVPGTHSSKVLRQTPWGVSGLRKITRFARGAVWVSILCPFVGSWDSAALARWCEAFECAPDRLEVVWIDKDHPWARDCRWLLTRATVRTFVEARTRLLRLRHEPVGDEWATPFHEEHRFADQRWSHAKAYSFRHGNSRRLLVTSANFSPAAWGRHTENGDLAIENFELGVCVDQDTWPFEGLRSFARQQDVATIHQLPSRGTSLITWAQAAWDGKKVDVTCSCKSPETLAGKITNGTQRTPISRWSAHPATHLCSAQVPWKDSKRPPLLVYLTCEQDSVNVTVFDQRPLGDREDYLPPEVDEDVAQTMLDQLLFEQYGGRIADEDAVKSKEMNDDPPEGNGGNESRDDYDVPAFVLARRHLGVVDNWAKRVEKAADLRVGEFERQVLRRDGQQLAEAFKRQVIRDGEKAAGCAIGARLAAEELELRLKQLPEV
jgi:hypothetical protein